jgi:RNA polymerase-binding transcription factor DksA
MNTEQYKEMLEKEVEQIKVGLSTIGHETDVIKNDWTPNATSEPENDVDLLADQAEELETNAGIVDTLEERLQEVNNALTRIETGTFGKCMVCGRNIETQRLDANPAATTCLACTE